MLLPTITGYLSVRTNARGERVWTVLHHNQPLCADTTDPHSALAVAQRAFDQVSLFVWDGDEGAFTCKIPIAHKE